MYPTKENTVAHIRAAGHWLEIYDMLKEIAERTRDLQFRAMMARLKPHADAARESLNALRSVDPDEYLRRYRRAYQSISKFPEL